jgi:hypothetical protein
MVSCWLAVDSTALACRSFRRVPPRCVFAGVVACREGEVNSLPRGGSIRRKCRPSPQMRNGASTATLVWMFQCTARATYQPTLALLQASEHVYGTPARPSFPVGSAQK